MGENQGEIANVFAISLIGLIVMLVFALSVIVFYLYYQRRLIEHQQKVGQLRDKQQKQLLRASIQAQEDERQRIAQDLHDGIGVILTTSQLFIRQAVVSPETAEHRQTSLDLIDDSLTNLRSIIYDLSPHNLFHFGLAVAIEDLAKKTNALPQLTVFFTTDGNQRLPLDTASNLYRLVQELFANTIRHAQATRITIELSLKHSMKSLRYQDNGEGMSYAAGEVTGLKKGSGYGLRNIESRAKILDGNLKITTAPGEGFSLQLDFRVPAHTDLKQ